AERHAAKATAGQPGRRPITPARHLSRADLIDAGTAADERALTCHHTANKLVEPQAQSSAASWRREKPCPPRHPARSPETARRPRGGGPPRPARQYHPGRARHVENTIMSALVLAGVVPRSYLLTTRGRKTGHPRTNPVVPVEHGGRRWLVAPYGPVSWVHNARAAGRVSLTRRRDTRDYTIRD